MTKEPHHDRTLGTICWLALGMLAGIGFMALFSPISAGRAPVPVLIAHDCPDSGGDLFAMNEDDFPYGCKAIEANL